MNKLLVALAFAMSGWTQDASVFLVSLLFHLRGEKAVCSLSHLRRHEKDMCLSLSSLGYIRGVEGVRIRDISQFFQSSASGLTDDFQDHTLNSVLITLGVAVATFYTYKFCRQLNLSYYSRKNAEKIRSNINQQWEDAINRQENAFDINSIRGNRAKVEPVEWERQKLFVTEAGKKDAEAFVGEMQRIIIVRHGTSVWNEAKKLDGPLSQWRFTFQKSYTDAQLTATGVEDAHIAAARLGNLMDGIGTVITSGMSRANETGMRTFFGPLSRSQNPADYYVDATFREERSKGIAPDSKYDGKRFKDVKMIVDNAKSLLGEQAAAKIKERYDAASFKDNKANFQQSFDQWGLEGDPNPAQRGEVAVKKLLNACSEHPDSDIALVSHSAFMKRMAAVIDPTLRKNELKELHIANGHILVAYRSKRTGEIVAYQRSEEAYQLNEGETSWEPINQSGTDGLRMKPTERTSSPTDLTPDRPILEDHTQDETFQTPNLITDGKKPLNSVDDITSSRPYEVPPFGNTPEFKQAAQPRVDHATTVVESNPNDIHVW